MEVTRVYFVTCPINDELIELAPDASPGDRYVCGGRTYVLTWAYGSWALEEAPDT